MIISGQTMMSFWFCLCMVILVNIQHVISRDYETIGKLKDLGIKHWFTAEEKSQLLNKRVRREIRDLTRIEWHRITDAMNIMKYTPGNEGRLIYGNEYLSYDELVCWHTQTSFSENGDYGHGYPHFGIWHRGFMLLFEKIILLIDNDIESFPYWDYRIDSKNPKNSIIFSEDYIGNLMGDSNNGYAISNGPFAYWPMSFGKDVGCENKNYNNIFGLMRSYINPNPSLYVSRIGTLLCNNENNNIGSINAWNKCLKYESYEKFMICFETTVHIPAHTGIGGTIERNFIDKTSNEYNSVVNNYDYLKPKKENNGLWCHNWLATSHIEIENHKIFRFYSHPNNECFECDKMKCSLKDENSGKIKELTDSEMADCICKPTMYNENNNANCIMDISDDFDISSNNDDDVSGNYRIGNMNHELVEHIWGDMLDAISSVNDPIFFFHHFNMDRYTYLWQIQMYEKRDEYYGYPVTGYEYGTNLNDVASPERPFKGTLFDWKNEKANKDITIGDIFEETSFINAPYIYDDIYEAIFADDRLYAKYMKTGHNNNDDSSSNNHQNSEDAKINHMVNDDLTIEENNKNNNNNNNKNDNNEIKNDKITRNINRVAFSTNTNIGNGENNVSSYLIFLALSGFLLSMIVVLRILKTKNRQANEKNGNNVGNNSMSEISVNNNSNGSFTNHPFGIKNVDYYGSTRTDLFV